MILLSVWRIDGKLVLDVQPTDEAIAKIVDQDIWRGAPIWEGRAEILARTASAPLIRDDTMPTEWWAFETYP